MQLKNYYALLLVGCFSFLMIACNSPEANNEVNANENNEKSNEDRIAEGQKMITIGGCNDCHSPKIMSQFGPKIDSSKFLAGHWAQDSLPPVYAGVLQPGNWLAMTPSITAFAGPWGISYAANITSDSTTGIGAWTEHNFIQAMKTGKHMGMENERPIMPPMPYENLAQLSDDELKSIFAYLKSTTPISNRVPAPVPPNQVATK